MGNQILGIYILNPGGYMSFILTILFFLTQIPMALLASEECNLDPHLLSEIEVKCVAKNPNPNLLQDEVYIFQAFTTGYLTEQRSFSFFKIDSGELGDSTEGFATNFNIIKNMYDFEDSWTSLKAAKKDQDKYLELKKEPTAQSHVQVGISFFGEKDVMIVDEKHVIFKKAPGTLGIMENFEPLEMSCDVKIPKETFEAIRKNIADSCQNFQFE